MFTFDAWLSLSSESREELAKLLPPTAFTTFIPTIDPAHPSVAGSDSMDIDSLSEQVQEALDPMLFSDPHFLAALRTFQDHLHSGWLTEDHRTRVDKYRAGIEDGTMHAAWKDEAWSQSQIEEDAAAASKLGPTSLRFVFHPIVIIFLGCSGGLSSELCRQAGGIKLSDLLEGGFLGVGDVLAYKRTFSHVNVTVEKDIMVRSLTNPNAPPLPHSNDGDAILFTDRRGWRIF